MPGLCGNELRTDWIFSFMFFCGYLIHNLLWWMLIAPHYTMKSFCEVPFLSSVLMMQFCSQELSVIPDIQHQARTAGPHFPEYYLHLLCTKKSGKTESRSSSLSGFGSNLFNVRFDLYILFGIVELVLPYSINNLWARRFEDEKILVSGPGSSHSLLAGYA